MSCQSVSILEGDYMAADASFDILYLDYLGKLLSLSKPQFSYL